MIEESDEEVLARLLEEATVSSSELSPYVVAFDRVLSAREKGVVSCHMEKKLEELA